MKYFYARLPSVTTFPKAMRFIAPIGILTVTSASPGDLRSDQDPESEAKFQSWLSMNYPYIHGLGSTGNKNNQPSPIQAAVSNHSMMQQ